MGGGGAKKPMFSYEHICEYVKKMQSVFVLFMTHAKQYKIKHKILSFVLFSFLVL